MLSRENWGVTKYEAKVYGEHLAERVRKLYQGGPGKVLKD